MEGSRPFRHLSSVPEDALALGPPGMSSDDPYAHERVFDDNPGPWSRRPSGLMGTLVTLAGGADALWRLGTEPLPDEPFDWSTVEADDRAFVTRVLELSDRCCDETLDHEYRTIARRILARIAERDPRALRRSANATRFAAGLVWLAGRANGRFDRRSLYTSRRLWAWFDVGDCADRGWSLRRAAGLEPDALLEPTYTTDVVSVGDPGLLHSHYRARLIAQRDACADATPRRNWSRADGRTANVQAEPVKVVTAAKGVLAQGSRATLVIGFGDDLESAHFVALTVPDAHELVRMVGRALGDPLPTPPGSPPEDEEKRDAPRAGAG